MIALLAALALAEPTDLDERLLGPAPTASETASGGLPTWAWALGGAAAVGGMALLSRGLPQRSVSPLTVVGKASLAAGSSVAVVEFKEGGRSRRFLIGAGHGAPTLLAEIDEAPFTEELAEPIHAAPAPAPSASPKASPVDRGRRLVDEILGERTAPKPALVRRFGETQ